GKSHVESFTGYRDLNAEFEDYFDNSINEVNVAGTLVPTVGQISPNSTNTFSAARPLNATASLTHGKSSFIDASQLHDDPDKPELEEITYSDDEDDVGAEADFNNLDTSITVSPIPTSRVHKYHHVTQIIGKFDRKVDEGFLVRYSVSSKAFRVFNSRTRIVQETLHVNFLENKPNVAGTGPTWLFDIDSLTRTMNYQPVNAGNQSNRSVGFQKEFDAGKTGEEANQQYTLLPVWSTGSTNPQNKEGDTTFDGKSPVDYFIKNRDFNADFKDYFEDSNNDVTAAGLIVPAAGQNYSNSTNPISIAGPSNTNTSPTHGKSLLQDASQSPD
nr:retrovirus-related Pol polyprotein from transposon TNT 1-94 [Tanacetum cinerariifolium]